MIARNNPLDLPVFYGTRIIEISARTTGFGAPGAFSPADLLTRAGSTLNSGCTAVSCQTCHQLAYQSILSDQILSALINRLTVIPLNPLTEFITELLEHKQSYTKVLNSICLIQKGCKIVILSFLSTELPSYDFFTLMAYLLQPKTKNKFSQPDIFYMSLSYTKRKHSHNYFCLSLTWLIQSISLYVNTCTLFLPYIYGKFQEFC